MSERHLLSQVHPFHHRGHPISDTRNSQLRSKNTFVHIGDSNLIFLIVTHRKNERNKPVKLSTFNDLLGPRSNKPFAILIFLRLSYYPHGIHISSLSSRMSYHVQNGKISARHRKNSKLLARFVCESCLYTSSMVSLFD